MGDFTEDQFLTDMDYRDRLERNRLLVVQSLDLDRHFMFSYLRSNNVFDEEDCELIQNSGTTRHQKNSKFLDVLATRGESAYNGFVEALEYDLPSLYEAFTGKKAQLKTDSLNCRRKSEFQIFDSEFLSRELSKLSEQYNSLTYMHGKLQKEKQLLEKQLIKVTGDLKSSIKSEEELKFELSLKNTSEKEINQHEKQEMNDLLVHCQALVQDNTDKSNIIIALQARLLAINEDRDEMNKTVDELQMKNKNLMQQVKDLYINYDFQRTRSTRLQEKYEKSNNELGKFAALNRELHQAKFNLSKVNEENEALHKKLEEYRNVVPALNAKLYLLQEQNEVESEKRSEISEEYMKIRQQARAVVFERDHGNQVNQMLKEKIARLEQSVESFREQTEFLDKELNQTLGDRDRAMQEREEVAKYNNELLKSRDSAVKNHVDIFKKMEHRNSEANKQLESTKKELKDLMIENVRKSSSKDGQMRCEIFETELSNTKKNLANPLHRQLSKSLTSTTVVGGSAETVTAKPPFNTQHPAIVAPEETCSENAAVVDKTDVSRKPSVLDQAKAVLDGRPKSVDFSTLNNRQLSWVYDSLKGNATPFQAVLNNPLVFPQFENVATTPPASNSSSDSETCEASMPHSPSSTEKRRIGSNRMVRTKRSNVAIDSIKAMLSPQINRRKSQPAESLKLNFNLISN